jgi:ABC-type branched-subunit amino acid transport system substrate-binding protein
VIQSDKVALIMGPFHDDPTLSIAALTSSVPMLNVKWSPEGYSQVAIRNSYAFWTSQINQHSTYPLGLYAYDQGIRTVATLGTENATSNDFLQGFVDGFRSKSGKVVRQQMTPPGEKNYSSYLANLKPADAFVCAIRGEGKIITIQKIQRARPV